MKSAAEQLPILERGIVDLHSRKELEKKLSKGEPLRIKLGVDPTAPDLHLGHAVVLQKLRQFQDLGHQIVLIIGDFTAQIGDPSGRNATRPPLTHEEVLANAETFKEQAFLVIERDKTEVVHNGDWFGKMNFTDVVGLVSKVTMQQMLQREDFRKRMDDGTEVRLHEILYPVMQGWDSVEVRADVEIGGSDQLFNILVGRDFQKGEGIEPQIVMTLPLLEGTDGTRKMSKSYGNYVGLTEEPSEIFGKIMSIPDELMPRYFELVLGMDPPADDNPRDAKVALGKGVVALYHDEAAGEAAAESFFKRTSGDSSAELPLLDAAGETDPIAVTALALQLVGTPRSNGDIRRLIQQGAIQIDGEKIASPKEPISAESGKVLRLGKKHSVRFR